MRQAAVAAIAALAAIGVLAMPRFGGEPGTLVAAETPAPAAPAPGVPVTAGTVQSADVPVFLNAIGTVQAFNTVAIKSRVDGQIVAIRFNEGDEIKVGAPLLQIDPRPYQATLDQAMAAKQKDEVQLANAEADLARYAQLVGPGFQTRQSYDQQKALVAQLQASLKGDAALIESAQINLNYTDIRSPIDGRLGARLVDIGNLVHATDSTGLVTITQVKPIFVTFTVAQDNLDQIREGQARQPLVVRAFSGDGKRQLADGKLTLIDNAIDQATGTIHLKASFANSDERLWPGEFVNLRVVLNTRRGVATVPAQTVQDGPNGQFAYVIKPDNTVERREVGVAAVQDGIAVISKGLAAGDRVVVEGQYRLTNGARVQPAAAGAAG